MARSLLQLADFTTLDHFNGAAQVFGFFLELSRELFRVNLVDSQTTNVLRDCGGDVTRQTAKNNSQRFVAHLRSDNAARLLTSRIFRSKTDHLLTMYVNGYGGVSRPRTALLLQGKMFVSSENSLAILSVRWVFAKSIVIVPFVLLMWVLRQCRNGSLSVVNAQL